MNKSFVFVLGFGRPGTSLRSMMRFFFVQNLEGILFPFCGPSLSCCPLTLVNFFEWLGLLRFSFVLSCLSLGGEGMFVSCIPWVTFLVALFILI